jgi:predicted kinase
MSKKLIIMSGPSGAGKSTYVKENYSEGVICSADRYFEELAMLNQTSYEEEFQPYLLAKAHQFCWWQFIHAIKVMDEPLVVIDNTNTQKWEFENYEFLAELEGYEVERVVVPFDPDKAEVYHSRNKHGVPLEVIERQIRDFEY